MSSHYFIKSSSMGGTVITVINSPVIKDLRVLKVDWTFTYNNINNDNNNNKAIVKPCVER